jgi:hypothetical protein
MIVIGGLGSLACAVLVILWIGGCRGQCEFVFLIPLILFIPTSLTFWGGIFLIIKERKWAWWLSVVMLFVMIFISGFSILSSVNSYNLNIKHSGNSPVVERHALKEFRSKFSLSVISFSLFVFPLILLLLDRKNFWKIAS